MSIQSAHSFCVRVWKLKVTMNSERRLFPKHTNTNGTVTAAAAAGETSEGNPAGLGAAASNLSSLFTVSSDVSPGNHNLHMWERPHQHFAQHTGRWWNQRASTDQALNAPQPDSWFWLSRARASEFQQTRTASAWSADRLAAGNRTDCSAPSAGSSFIIRML